MKNGSYLLRLVSDSFCEVAMWSPPEAHPRSYPKRNRRMSFYFQPKLLHPFSSTYRTAEIAASIHSIFILIIKFCKWISTDYILNEPRLTGKLIHTDWEPHTRSLDSLSPMSLAFHDGNSKQRTFLRNQFRLATWSTCKNNIDKTSYKQHSKGDSDIYVSLHWLLDSHDNQARWYFIIREYILPLYQQNHNNAFLL